MIHLTAQVVLGLSLIMSFLTLYSGVGKSSMQIAGCVFWLIVAGGAYLVMQVTA